MGSWNPRLLPGRLGRWLIWGVLLGVIVPVHLARTLFAGDANGFDLTGSSVPVGEILPGGPPRDGIPALTDPDFEAVTDAGWLGAGDRVLGVHRNGEARAYPVRILNWHEIVNDRIGGEPVVISYCPLCGTGIGFLAEADGRRTFGVSGLLYNSDVLMYDRESESLWSQIPGRAVSGPMRGKQLRRIVLEHTTWADWRMRYPDTAVLSRNTGHRRDYDRNPYADYARSPGLYFPVSTEDPRYPRKTFVLAVGIGDTWKAYPFPELERAGGRVRDRLAGQEVEVIHDAEHRTARALDENGRALPAYLAYWFAWYAFYPEAPVYTAPGRDTGSR